MPDSDAVAGARRFLEGFVRMGLHPRLGPSAAGHDAVVAMVEAGAGYSLSVREEVAVPEGLVFVPLAEDVPPIEVVFLWNRQAEVDDLAHAARHLARTG